MNLLYLAIDIAAVIIPVIFSFHPKINFYRYWKYFLVANIIVSTFFIIWDIVFTRLGVWSFNKDYISGLYLINLPIEEVLFFICIPFACLFTYHCLEKKYEVESDGKAESVLLLFLTTVTFVIGIFSIDKIYTAVCFISTACFCLYLFLKIKPNWISLFIISYLILLIPFAVVNGILTGTGLSAPVVKYNPTEIIGIRIVSIPIEDFVYAFELILLNLFAFKKFQADAQ